LKYRDGLYSVAFEQSQSFVANSAEFALDFGRYMGFSAERVSATTFLNATRIAFLPVSNPARRR
jgi:hypothetical protein